MYLGDQSAPGTEGIPSSLPTSSVSGAVSTHLALSPYIRSHRRRETVSLDLEVLVGEEHR